VSCLDLWSGTAREELEDDMKFEFWWKETKYGFPMAWEYIAWSFFGRCRKCHKINRILWFEFDCTSEQK
jgi:hypothetical protein